MFWLTEVSVDPPDQKKCVRCASGVLTALPASSEAPFTSCLLHAPESGYFQLFKQNTAADDANSSFKKEN